MLEFLPKRLLAGIGKAGEENIYEIRIRKDSPVTVNYKGAYLYLNERGVSAEKRGAFICDGDEIEETLFRAGNYSVYSVEEQIRRGFITADCGVRVGIAGEYAFEKGEIVALKTPLSLCVRVPHRIENAGAEIYSVAAERALKNVLILSAPGRGKTTILRDFAEKVAGQRGRNVLICDERGEIAPCGRLKNADVISFADKKQAFDVAIRALRPDVIVTDELSEEDVKEVRRAIRSGVYVAASAHFDGVKELPSSFCGVFDVYVVLSSDAIGKIDGVYAKDFSPLPF